MNLSEATDLCEQWREAMEATESGCTTSLCNAYNWCILLRGVIRDVYDMSPDELQKAVAKQKKERQ